MWRESIEPTIQENLKMRMKRCVFLPCVALACALSSGLAHSQTTTAPGSSRTVRGWEGTITIPTYKLGPADPNPAFPLVSKRPVYPYTMLDDLTNDRVPMTYRAIYLENKYLKIIILPQLGGHVYSVYDKIDHREVLYHYNVIKYSLVAIRGAWIPSGMEFSFPYAHTAITVSPVESVLRHNLDGSATAVIGAVDWVSNMHWEVAITLRPDTARVEEGVTLFNSTPQNHLYYFWTNTGVKVSDDAQYIYPERETVKDDPFGIVRSWPVWNGVDQSWWKNDPTHMPIFGRDVRRNFFGMYYHQSNYGVVHVADYRQNPGKKIWTLGTSPSGMIWGNILSDNGDPYGEIQSGRFYTQGEREFMNPRRIDRWTEYWYPVRGLDGGFVEATSQLAINAVYPSGDSASPQVKLLVSPVADVTDATFIVKQGPKLLLEFHHVHFAPMRPATYTIPVQNVEEAKKSLDVEIQSAQGKTLLSWSAAAPIDGNPNFIPMAGKPLATPIPINAHTPIEQLYLQGVFLQKTGKKVEALKFFDRVLDQDPGYLPALVKEAWYYYGTTDFKKADSLIEFATRRDTENSYVAYTAGVIDRAEGKFSLANNAFWNSIHYGAAIAPGPSLAASYVELGEIAIRQGRAAQAIDLLKNAVGYNSDDAFALADLAAAERFSGNLHDAQRYSAEAVEKMPLLPYALAEQWQDQSDVGATANAASPANFSWSNVLNSDPQNYLAVASWYHSIGAWQSSNAVLHIAEQDPSVQEIAPMVDYYLASNTRHLGHDRQADEYERKAAASTITSVFPNRLEDVSVLREALNRNPSDAQAQYSLGNFLFAKNRYDEAAALWQEALAEGFKNAVVLRNLGIYQWHVKHNMANAAEDYSEAIRLSPADYRLYSRLDEIYTEEGDTAARVKLFQKAPAAVLDQDTIRARRALLFIEQGKDDSALALFANHLYNKQEEDDNEFHNMFVVANMEKGKRELRDRDPQQAEASFRQSLQYPENLRTGAPAQPDTAEQMYWIGNALQAQGKTAEAESAWQKAADQGKGKTNASAVYSALAYRKLGHDDEAQQLLQGCIQSAARPKPTAEDYFAAGSAAQCSNHADQARKYFQQALDVDPLFWQARIALKNLES
jgi:tetratricopeptide (TPR) repeat protein